jgi:hypothetical protein
MVVAMHYVLPLKASKTDRYVIALQTTGGAVHQEVGAASDGNAGTGASGKGGHASYSVRKPNTFTDRKSSAAASTSNAQDTVSAPSSASAKSAAQPKAANGKRKKSEAKQARRNQRRLEKKNAGLPTASNTQ